MLELQRPDSLVVRVVSAIRAEIDSGQLAPESRLPTEQQLAEQLNVSRSVVREAIAQLKADGVLTARRGLGSFISQTPVVWISMRFWVPECCLGCCLGCIFEVWPAPGAREGLQKRSRLIHWWVDDDHVLLQVIHLARIELATFSV